MITFVDILIKLARCPVSGLTKGTNMFSNSEMIVESDIA